MAVSSTRKAVLHGAPVAVEAVRRLNGAYKLNIAVLYISGSVPVSSSYTSNLPLDLPDRLVGV